MCFGGRKKKDLALGWAAETFFPNVLSVWGYCGGCRRAVSPISVIGVTSRHEDFREYFFILPWRGHMRRKDGSCRSLWPGSARGY